MPQRRRSKYKREATRGKRPPLAWTDNKARILSKVTEYRYSTTPMLCAVTGMAFRSVNRHTEALFRNHYINRRHFPHPRNGGGSSPSIHTANRKGRDWLLTHPKAHDVEPEFLQTLATENESDEPVALNELRHNLLGSHLHAVIEAACNARPDVRLDFWYNESDEFYTDVEDQGRRYPVRLDAFCQVSTYAESTWHPHPFMVEDDRSTMSHKSMRRKYRGYFLLWRQYLRRGGTLPQFKHIERFRVLTITEKAKDYQVAKHEDRLSNLLQDAYVADDHGLGSNLFWFARLNDLPLDNPTAIFSPIWHVGDRRKPERHSLLLQGVSGTRPVKDFASASDILDSATPAREAVTTQ